MKPSQLTYAPDSTFSAIPSGGTKSVDGAVTQGQASGKETSRYADSRNLVTETIAAMDLPRISFLRKETKKKTSGLDRAEFIMALAT